ncbi:MAG TPA: nuclear transport factor 2 family protein [Mycobacterium sp.]|nr:nuclear transport factor 2 family protein [Mycobacterium sp.]
MIDETSASARQIGDVLARYCVGMDTGRMGDVLAVFTADATLTMFGQTASGSDAIRSLFQNLGRRAANVPGLRSTKHQLTTWTHSVSADGTANSIAYVTVMTNLGLDNWGQYEDELRLIEGQWRITTRTLTIDGYTPGGVGAVMSDNSTQAASH